MINIPQVHSTPQVPYLETKLAYRTQLLQLNQYTNSYFENKNQYTKLKILEAKIGS